MSGYRDGFSSDPDEDSDKVAGTTFSRGRPDLHRKITKIKEMVFSDEEGDSVMSPIGSPMEGFNLGGRGKFVELKKKLEEDQAKRSKLAASNSDENFSDGIQALDVTSILESLRTNNELRDQSRVSSMSMRLDNHPKFTELKRQIKERDHKILDYESRLNEMDRQAVDLQDTLSQREKLLSSKNEAVNVVHSKYRKELEQKDQELRKTQQTMFNLEKNLSGIQDQFNSEKDRLTQEVKLYQEKMDVLRDSTKALEVKTEALEAKTTVLEEEISRLRNEKQELSIIVTEKDVLIADKEKLLSNNDVKIQELVTANEKLDLTLKKLKTQFQVKLRALKEKQTEMEQAVKSVERVKELENQIAELEEEKGNFLLQKMENEDEEASKSMGTGIEIADLESQIQNERNTIEKLEKELTVRAAQQEDIISEHRIELGLLQNELTNYKECTESSLASYQRTISELEDQLLSTGSIKELESHISLLKVDLTKANETNELLETKLSSHEVTLAETGNKLEALEWDHQNVLESCNALSTEISRLTSTNEATLNEVHAQYKQSLERKEEELQTTQETVVELRKNLDERQMEIMMGEMSNVEVISSQTTIAELENQLTLTRAEADRLFALNDELSRVKTENEFFQVKIRDQELKLNSNATEIETLKWDHQCLFQSSNDLSNEIKILRESRNDELEYTIQNEHQTKITLLGQMEPNVNPSLELMHENENLLDEIEKQRHRIEYLEQVEHMNMETLAQVEQNYLERISESERLEDELEETKSRLKNLNINLEILSNENNRLMHEVEFLKSNTIESFDTKNIVDEDDILLLRQGNEKLVLGIAEKDTKIEELITSNGKLEMTLKRLKAQFQTKLKALKEKQTDMEEALKSNARVKELENRIAELEEEKGNFLLQKMENDEVNGSNDLRNETIQLETQLQTERKRIEEYEKDITFCKSEKEDLISEHRIEVGLLQTELTNYKESTCASYQTIIQEQIAGAEKLEEIQSCISFLKDEILHLREEKEVLQVKLDSEGIKSVETETELESLKWDHQNILESCNALSAEISRLNTTNEETVRQIHAQYKQSLNEKETVLQTVEDKTLQLETKLIQSRNELDILKMDHQNLLENYEALSSQISRLSSSNEEFVNELRAEHQNVLQLKMTELEQTTQNASVELQAKLKETVNELETLKLEHERVLENSNTLSLQIRSLNSNNEEVLREVHDEYKKSLDLKTTELETLQETAAVLQTTLAESRNEMETFKWDYKSALENCSFLTSEISRLNSTKEEALSGVQAEYKKTLEQKTIELHSVQESLVQIQAKLTETENELEISKLDHQSVLENCETLSNEISRLNSTKEEALSGVHAEYKKTVKLKTLELQAVRESLVEVQAKLTETENELEISKWDHQNVLENCNALSNEISRLNSTNEEAEYKTTLEFKTLELQAVRESLVQLQAKLTETENELETSKWDHQNVLENCNALSNEISRLNSTNEEALYKTTLELKTLELQAVQENVAQLQVKLSEAVNELESLKWDHQNVLESCEALSTEISRLNLVHEEALLEVHSHYKKSFGEKEVELQRAEETVKKLQTSLESETARVQELETEAAAAVESLSFQSIIAELENQLSLARINQNNLNSLQAELGEMKVEREFFQTQIQDQQRTLELNASELERLKWDHQNFVESCDDMSTEIRNIQESKKQELDIAHKQNQAYTQFIADYQTQLNSHQANTERLEALLVEIENQKGRIEQLEQLDRLQKEKIAGLEQNYRTKNIEAEGLQYELEEAKYQISDITINLEIISHESSRLMGEVSSLKSESAALRTELSRRTLELESFSKQSSPSPSDSLITGSNDGNDQSAQTDEDKQKLTSEVKELRVRNGKLTLRFKQVKEKYDELMKEKERLKNSKFSLDSALEDVLQEQVKEKDERLNENEKILFELQGEKERLCQKVDLLERANDKLVEIKESQETYVKQLHQEISALKWRIEELENLTTADGGNSDEFVSSNFSANSQTYENQILKDHVLSLENEIRGLQSENFSLSSTVAEINSLNLKHAQNEIGRTTTAINLEGAVGVVTSGIGSGETVTSMESSKIMLLQQRLDDEERERKIFERKIDLLQGKILEIEESEMKCFEESLMLKSWTRELEVDNQKYQAELEQIYNSVTDGDINNVKVRTLQNEIIRLVDTLQDRDRRCEELTAEITRLLEERDGLQLKLSNVLQHNTSLHVEGNKGKEFPEGEIQSFDREILEQKLGELEQINYVINMDLRREKEARRLVQEQLFFSQSSRGYKSQHPRGNRSPVSPPSPPMRSPSRPSIPSSMSSPAVLPITSMLPTQIQIPPTVLLQPSSQSQPIPFPVDQFQTVDLNSEIIPTGANHRLPPPPPSPVMQI